MTNANRRAYERLNQSLVSLESGSEMLLAKENEDGSVEIKERVDDSYYVNTDDITNTLTLPLGADNFGADVLTKLASSIKSSLQMGLMAGVIATAIGLLLGLLAGYLGGWIDNLLVFVMNIFTVIPSFVILILIANSVGQSARGPLVVAIIIGCTAWPWTARSVRSQVLTLRGRDHVNLSKLSGHSLDYLSPQMTKGYRYLSVPKELLENPVFSSLDYGAVILFAKMLERAGMSARHEDKFTDENGRLFIIYTVEQMERDIRRSHPTVIKFTKQLADIGLIEKVHQGQGKPTKIYIRDFTSVESSAQKAPDFNICKSEKLTPDSQENGLLDVKNLSSIELNHKDLENKDLPTFHQEDRREVNEMTEKDVEELQAEVRAQIEYTVLCENYGEDLTDEVVEIITEALCRDGLEMKIGRTSIFNHPGAETHALLNL